MARTPMGVRQVNENVLQKGRALILNNENFNEYNWNDLPNGTLHIDEDTGNISVKIKGETTWVPIGLKNDGTLVISRDTQFNEETFVVKNVDFSEEEFIYENEDGEQRYKPKDIDGFVFEIEKGTYLKGRNHLEVTIDDCLTRTVMNGGIEEIDERRFKITDTLVNEQKVSVRYVKWTKIGNPYPRFFLNEEEPDAEIGDFWLDPNGSLEEDSLEDIIKDNPSTVISWGQISGKPTTIVGYGIKDNVEIKGHTHRALDITDFPTKLPANGGDSNTVQGREPGGAPGNIAIVSDNGYLASSLLSPNVLSECGALFVQDTKPTSPKDKSIWICTDKITNTPHIEVYYRHTWIKL